MAAAEPAGGGGGPAAEAPLSLAVLDREQFRGRLEIKALRIPTKQCHRYMQLLSK